MDTIQIRTIVTGTLLCIAAALYWGAVLSLKLPLLGRFFDRKPFNCRPCLTFHLAWMLTGVFALIGRSLPLFGIGVGIAFIVFFIVKYIDSKKVTK
ncbi:hypothetical protein D0T84_20760 [Dysgonomonas sp. 521]|uniref:hypothetical protein n=1 Tax=Dysgonomonas sp. 521 TaxID=2302932 RepID=UPI0013D4A84E|nr:hypothetical protein [Dysgonomonas sp. 521]NDV97310.1 hypothetical protein [Dysgonomonas sp. 521]